MPRKSLYQTLTRVSHDSQLIFIAVVLAAIALARRIARHLKIDAPSWGWRVPPYAIGGIASFWVVQRVAAF